MTYVCGNEENPGFRTHDDNALIIEEPVTSYNKALVRNLFADRQYCVKTHMINQRLVTIPSGNLSDDRTQVG